MTSTPVQSAPSPAPAPVKAKKKHWFLRILVSLVVLLLLIAMVVQIVLWTDLPRGIVVKQIEGQLGLRLSVKSLTTGWLGHTELHDVTIGLPLSDKAFLDVPVMKVKNTSLFGLIIGQPVEVQAIELDKPHLYVVQDSAGQWNLQQVAELLARAGGKKSGEESAATSSTPKMPKVHLTDGIISILDNKNRGVDIQPLTVDGYSDTGVSWKYDVEVDSKLSVTGRLVPGGNWAHEVAVNLHGIGDWVKPWDANFPNVAVNLNWRGALATAGVEGRLDIQQASITRGSEIAQASGSATLQAGANGVLIHPDKLLLKTGIKAVPDITLALGTIDFDPAAKTVKADQLLVSVFGGAVKVAADYNLNSSAANVEVAWDRLSAGSDIVHSGGLRLNLREPFPGKIIVDGHLTSVGNEGPGQWLLSANFNATGRAFNNFNWTINADKVQWQRHVQGLNLDGLAMAGAVREDSVTLTSIGLPNKDLLSGTAGYSFVGKQAWEVHLKGQRWPFKPIAGTELGFILNVRGDKSRIILDDFTVKSPDALMSTNAVYTIGVPKPLSLNLSIVNAPPRQMPVALAANPKTEIFNGTIDGHFSVEGTLDPIVLDVRGELDGREVDIRGHHLGNVRLALSKDSHIDENGVFIYTDALSLFGGKWDIDGVYVPDWNDLTLDVDMRDVQLQSIATFADQQDMAGTITGKLRVSLPGLNFTPDNVIIPATSFTVKNMNVHHVLVDQLDATLWMKHGHFEIDPLRFKHAEGTGDMRIGMDLGDFRKIDVKTKITNWPIDIQGAAAHINASVDIPDTLIELPNPNSTDPKYQQLRVTATQIDVLGTTTLKGKELGDLIVHAGINGRTLDVRGVHMKLLGGRLDGQAHAEIDRPLASTAEFTWENLDLKQVAQIFPQANEVSGTLDGDLRVAPTTVPRPREPLAAVLTATLKNGAWRTLPISDLRLATYIGPNEQEVGGGWRAVMEDNHVDPSFIHLGGGTVEVWGRTEFGGRAASSQAQVAFRELNLNQFVHALDPKAAQMPGSVAGSVMLIRAPIPPHVPTVPMNRMFPAPTVSVVTPLAIPGPHAPLFEQLIAPIYGEGHVDLTRTNLANFGPFAFIYNLGKLFQNVNTPTGTGNIQFHLENGNLSIETMRYFNRGTEIRAVANVKDIYKGKDSPVNSTITLVGKPLASVKLPFFSDLSEAFTAIQNSLPLTAVRVGGTLDKPKPSQLGISQLGKQMRDLLASDAKGNGG